MRKRGLTYQLSSLWCLAQIHERRSFTSSDKSIDYPPCSTRRRPGPSCPPCQGPHLATPPRAHSAHVGLLDARQARLDRLARIDQPRPDAACDLDTRSAPELIGQLGSMSSTNRSSLNFSPHVRLPLRRPLTLLRGRTCKKQQDHWQQYL